MKRKTILLFILLVFHTQQVLAASAWVSVIRGRVFLGPQKKPITMSTQLEPNQFLTISRGSKIQIRYKAMSYTVVPRSDIPKFTLADLPKPNADIRSSANKLLQIRTSTARSGASRGSPKKVRITLPLEGELTTLKYITWDCHACGKQEVIVTDLENDEIVWSASSSSKVMEYSGPPLEPNQSYLVEVGQSEIEVTLPNLDTLTLISKELDAEKQALKSGNIKDPSSVAAAMVGVYLRLSLPTDALLYIHTMQTSHPNDEGLKEIRNRLKEHLCKVHLTAALCQEAPK